MQRPPVPGAKYVTIVVPYRVFLLQDSGRTAFYSSYYAMAAGRNVFVARGGVFSRRHCSVRCASVRPATALFQFRRRARLPWSCKRLEGCTASVRARS
jgi:hypothetical protein